MVAGIESRWRDEGSAGPGRMGRVAVYDHTGEETAAEALNRRLHLHVAVCRDCEADMPGCANGRRLHEQHYQAQRTEQESGQ